MIWNDFPMVQHPGEPQINCSVTITVWNTDILPLLRSLFSKPLCYGIPWRTNLGHEIHFSKPGGGFKIFTSNALNKIKRKSVDSITVMVFLGVSAFLSLINAAYVSTSFVFLRFYFFFLIFMIKKTCELWLGLCRDHKQNKSISLKKIMMSYGSIWCRVAVERYKQLCIHVKGLCSKFSDPLRNKWKANKLLPSPLFCWSEEWYDSFVIC